MTRARHCSHPFVLHLPQQLRHVQAGSARGELPADLQAALLSGRLPLDIVRRYLDLAAIPVLGALCRAFPGEPRVVSKSEEGEGQG